MAVEARHFNVYPQQERDLTNNSHQRSLIPPYTEQQMSFPAAPISNQSIYQQACNSVLPKTSIDNSASRKRCIDSTAEFYLGDNFPTALQYEADINAIISEHGKRMKLELQERQRQQTKLLLATIREGMTKRLKEKDDQIEKLGKLNMILQNRVTNLSFENELCRDMARTAAANAISLRTNLEHARTCVAARVAAVGDAESCCDNGGDAIGNGDKRSCYANRRCRQCGVEEPCVLLLQCRHLCLCNGCATGSNQPQACPVCNSTITAILHVNMY